MIFPMIADWFNNTMAFLFLAIIDTVCYGLLTVSYNIFYAVSQIDLFGGGTAGDVLYTEITKRLYMILSVVMVFVFAYHLIMMVIDPDGKHNGAMSQVVKDTLFSIILLIVLPLVYRSMAMFQFHVLENGTIPAIILGTNGQNSNQNPGKNVAMMVLVSFFHPNGTTYNTFFDENGYIRGDAVSQCLAETAAADGEEHPDTCELFTGALTKWADGNGWITNITTGEKKLRHWIGDTMSYSWILSSFAALAVAYVFFLYAIDIGVRAVKLGVLQLISPIPVVLRIFPNTKKTFDTWFSHMKKTYLELFIRVAVIFFALELVKLIPVFVGILFQSQDSSVAGAFTKCVATVILILGILKFGQEAPSLFKEIFSAGGNLLSGVNLKASPNVKKGLTSRVTDNKAAMWGLGKAAAISGGVRSSFGRQYRKNTEAALDATGNSHRLLSGLMALPSGLRGVVTGAKTNVNMSNLDKNSFRQATVAGAEAANSQYNKSAKLQAHSDNQAEFLSNLTDTGNPNPSARTQSVVRNVADYARGNIAANRTERDEKRDERDYQNEQYINRIRGDYAATSATAESLTGILEGLSNVKSNTKDKTKSVSKKIDDLQQKLNTSAVQSDPGTFNGVPPQQGTMSMGEFQQQMEQYNKQLEAHNARRAQYQEYLDTKALLDAAKAERNDIIANELKGSRQAVDYTVNTLDDVIDKIKKAPSGALGDANATAQILSDVENLRISAQNQSLSGADIKQLNSIIDNLTNAKIYASELSKLQQSHSESYNAPSGNSGGGDSGGSSGSSGGSKK